MTKKIALITGANQGIGFEIAKGLAAGDVTVLIGARSADRGEAAVELLRGDGADVRFVQLDVTDQGSVQAAAKLIELDHGRLDILVNNAGTAKADGSGNTSELTPATARDVFETNVFGVIAVTNALVDLLRASPGARVVNVSSVVGSTGYCFDPNSPLWNLQGGAYGASKAALNRLTTSYAREFWDTPIKVNAISPGYCHTDFGGPRLDGGGAENPGVGSYAEAPEGKRTAAQGAAIAIKLALIGADGPTGGFFADEPQFVDDVAPW